MTDPTSDYWKCVSKDDLTEEISFQDNFQYTYDMKERRKIAQEVLAAEVSPTSVLQEFITHLPDNHAIHAGYHIPPKQKVSLCPCSRIVSPWMKEHGINLEEQEYCSNKKQWNKVYDTYGLKGHLYHKSDSFHKAAYNYISRLYPKNYKFPPADAGTEALTRLSPMAEGSNVRAGKYMITVFQPGSLGVECHSNDDCVSISKIHPHSVLLNKVQVGDVIDEVNGTTVRNMDDLMSHSEANLRHIIMKHADSSLDMTLLDGTNSFMLCLGNSLRGLVKEQQKFLVKWSFLLHRMAAEQTTSYMKEVTKTDQLTPLQDKFIKSLTCFLPLHNDHFGFCPCMEGTKPWRESCKIDITDSCELVKSLPLKDLIDHMKSVCGYNIVKRDKGRKCFFHHAALAYLCIIHHKASIIPALKKGIYEMVSTISSSTSLRITSNDGTNNGSSSAPTPPRTSNNADSGTIGESVDSPPATTNDSATAGSNNESLALGNSPPRSVCDWAQVIACNQQFAPIKCHRLGCEKLVHHLCQIAWETKNKHPEHLPTVCCEHHPSKKITSPIDESANSESELVSEDDHSVHEIRLNDCIKYWSPTAIVGDESTAQYGNVLEIISIEDEWNIYDNYLWLDTLTYIQRSQIIEVSRKIGVDGSYDFSQSKRQSADKFTAVPGKVDQKVIDESTRRHSKNFEKIRDNAIESFDKDKGDGKGVTREEGRESGWSHPCCSWCTVEFSDAANDDHNPYKTNCTHRFCGECCSTFTWTEEKQCDCPVEGCRQESSISEQIDFDYIRELTRNIITYKIDGNVPDNARFKQKPQTSLTVG